MCGRYSVQKKTLLVANGLVKKNINVDLEQDNFNCAPGGKYPCIKSATNGKYLEMTVFGILPSCFNDCSLISFPIILCAKATILGNGCADTTDPQM